MSSYSNYLLKSIKKVVVIASLFGPIATLYGQEAIEQPSTENAATLTIQENNAANTALFIDEQEFEATPEQVTTPSENNPEEQPDEPANTPQQDYETFLAQAMENEQCEVILKTILENFNKLDFDLEHIALVVSNNQVRISTKKPILDEIRKLRGLVGMIKDGSFIVIKKENLGQLIELAQKLIGHVRYILTTNLISFKSFELEMAAAPTRLPLPKTYGFDQLEKMLQQNNNLLTRLETESENVGLNAFNKVFRRLEKLNNDYKVLSRLTIAAGIGAGIIWIGHRIPNAFWIKIYDFFGIDKTPKSAIAEANPQDQSDSQPNESQPTTSQPLLDPYNLRNFYDSNQSDITSNLKLPQNSYSSAKVKPPTDPISTREAVAQGVALGLQQDRKMQYDAMKQTDMANDAIVKPVIFGGDPAPKTKVPLKTMTENKMPVGYLSWLEILGERSLEVISFSVPPLILFDVIKPTLKEWGSYSYDWVKGRLSQLMSFLRGGPVKRQMDMWAEKEIKITFDDVIGNEHAKESLSHIVAYIVDYEKYDRAGIIPETGILLVGPPRTGKTYIAEALAGTIKMAFQERGSNETIRLLSFTTAELKQYGISTVLLGAKALAPVVLFIDEIDTGRFQREGDSVGLGELQVAMSTLNRDKSKKVIILAATNKPENLDYALLEPGRFGKHIHFTYPTTNERKEYLQRELTKRSANINEEYIDKLAHESEGCSYDALNEVIVTALQRAKMRGSILTWEDLDAAFDEEINKIIIDEQTIPESEQYIIAAHQAGHAYMRTVLNPSLQLTKVTIRPTAAKINEQSVISKYFDNNSTTNNKNQKDNKTVEYGKIFTAHNTQSLKFETYKDLINELIISLAGHCAEKVLFGASSHSYHTSDINEALSIAKHLVFNGMQEKDMPKKVKEQKLAEAYELVKKHEQEVTEQLMEHKQELIVLTNILFKQKTLVASDIIEIIKLVEQEKNKEPSENQDSIQEASAQLDVDALDIAQERPNA